MNAFLKRFALAVGAVYSLVLVCAAFAVPEAVGAVWLWWLVPLLVCFGAALFFLCFDRLMESFI